MPFVRFSRDERGCEHIFLMDWTEGGPTSRPRILFWHRIPSGVKAVRDPFDQAVRRELEAHYPNLTFDWARIAAARAAPPSSDIERWRERRRASRPEESDVKTREAVEAPPEIDQRPDLTAPEPLAGVAPAGQANGAARSRRRRRRGGRGGRPQAQPGPPDRE